MKKSKKIKDFVEVVKTFSDSLSENEREIMRDEMLAFLLFNEFKTASQKNEDSRLGNLTEHERKLIRKLSEQTELLNRLLNSDKKSKDH